MTMTKRRGMSLPLFTYPAPRSSNTPPLLNRRKRGVPRDRLRWLRWLLIGLIFILAFPILPYGLLRFGEETLYQPLHAGMRVARIHATATRTLNSMQVELTLYHPDGTPDYYHTYLLEGDRWLLRDEVISYAGWTGLQSGYKIVQLAGYNGKQMRPPTKDDGSLNGGEDAFFGFLKDHTWTASLGRTGDYRVYARPGPRPQGTTYDILLNGDGTMRTQQLENK